MCFIDCILCHFSSPHYGDWKLDHLRRVDVNQVRPCLFLLMSLWTVIAPMKVYTQI